MGASGGETVSKPDNQITFSPDGTGIEMGMFVRFYFQRPYRPRWYMLLLVVPLVRYLLALRKWRRLCNQRFVVKSVTSHSFTVRCEPPA